jgi:prepilin-type N-terminal cleavage/methylation domain-containing protein
MLKLQKLMNTKGFTLVELLIVIAVIGILAIAVLAALDPIEQLKKSRDTGRLADARELYNAYTRYYASYNCYPQEGANCVNATMTWGFTNSSNALNMTSGIFPMISSGELKPAFSGKQTIVKGEIHTHQSANDQMSVCFSPESKSARNGSMGQIMTSAFASGSCDLNALYTSTLNATCVLCVR